jgi:hypothetical protein
MCLALAFSATAFADFSWQTEPILGYGTYYNGDVWVNTWPIPTNIPHNSIPEPDWDGTEYYHTGSPSATLFYVGQSVGAGSGINIDLDVVYNWSSVYTQLTRPGGGSLRTPISYAGSYSSADDPFVMLSGTEDPFSASDIGTWSYTETWSHHSLEVTSITATDYFTVAAVPEPGSLVLLGSVLLGLAAAYRKKLA